MCGISGIYYFDGRLPDAQTIENMRKVLSHRGPDDSGVHIDRSIGLAHNRLSIIDLSAHAHQPMCNENGAVWIVFNGEIYNYQVLRKELIAQGHLFKSNSDTEVIIHGYEEWGDTLFSKLDGMFAFALWDKVKGKLVLARDHFGIKPLFYYADDEKVIFASEIKGILASKMVSKEINSRSLSNYLTYFYTPGPETLIKNIMLLQPAHFSEFSKERNRLQRYWRIYDQDDHAPNASLSEADLYERLKENIEASVGNAMVSDVPVGLLLSGGLDSNILLYEMSRRNSTPLHTCTLGFSEGSYDESALARRSADYFKSTHHQELFDKGKIQDYMAKSIFHNDSLNANPGGVAAYQFFKLCSSQTKVALTGTGLDEMFAGYSTYVADRINSYYQFSPLWLKKSLDRLARSLPVSYKKYGTDYLAQKFFQGSFYSADKAHYWWRTIITDDLKGELLENSTAHDSFDEYNKFYQELSADIDTNTRFLYADFNMFLIENAVLMYDALGMAHSLEVRPVYLQKDLVKFAFSIPFKYKLKGNRTKHCLRELYRGKLSSEIINKKKEGLVAPYSYLFNNDLREFVGDTLSKSRVSAAGVFKYNTVEKILNEHFQHKRNNSYMILVLLYFQIWHDTFLN
jgi:asparagine synthase (glutamine-hydrolysing)